LLRTFPSITWKIPLDWSIHRMQGFPWMFNWRSKNINSFLFAPVTGVGMMFCLTTSRWSTLMWYQVETIKILYTEYSLDTKYFIFFSSCTPVGIRVRIDPPHPLVCRKRRLNGAVLRMRREKPRSRVTAGVAR
jgi:hypothetical protein